jgi:hypothetical protein
MAFSNSPRRETPKNVITKIGGKSILDCFVGCFYKKLFVLLLVVPWKTRKKRRKTENGKLTLEFLSGLLLQNAFDMDFL